LVLIDTNDLFGTLLNGDVFNKFIRPWKVLNISAFVRISRLSTLSSSSEYFTFVGYLNLRAFRPNVKFAVGEGSGSDGARWSGEIFLDGI